MNDGGGLSAWITTGGAKSWYFQYKSPRNGKRAKICLGAYPNVSLAIARKFREEYSRLVRQFVDPKDFREQQRRDALSENSVTLAKVFEQWLAVWAEGKQETTVNKAVRQLELYALPKLGYLPVSRISAPIVIECLKPPEKKGKLETLSRVREKLTAIMRFAVHTGGDSISGWRVWHAFERNCNCIGTLGHTQKGSALGIHPTSKALIA